MKIDWHFPPARTGFFGVIDKLIGPGATNAEKKLQLYIPFMAGFAVVAHAYFNDLEWGWGQYLIAGLITVDIVGGIITNATSSAKRWFHREGQGFKQHMGFISIHFVQLTMLSWAFLDFDVFWIASVGGYMMLASAVILLTPLYLQRPIALIMYALAIVLITYQFTPLPDLVWFLPLFYIKLLLSHVLREEPYRPDDGR